MGMSSATMMSPSAVQESGSPKDHSRERSPHAINVGIPTAIQGDYATDVFVKVFSFIHFVPSVVIGMFWLEILTTVILQFWSLIRCYFPMI